MLYICLSSPNGGYSIPCAKPHFGRATRDSGNPAMESNERISTSEAAHSESGDARLIFEAAQSIFEAAFSVFMPDNSGFSICHNQRASGLGVGCLIYR